jgi:hypothetical protein
MTLTYKKLCKNSIFTAHISTPSSPPEIFPKPVNTYTSMATNEIPVHQSKLLQETRNRFSRLFEAMKEKKKACPVINGVSRLMARIYNLMN